MTPERWARIQQLAEEAAGRPPAEREAYVREAAHAEPDLFDEVMRVLAGLCWDDAGVHEAILNAAGELVAREPAGMIGRRLGAWQITERIAIGGMGAVYRAQRVAQGFEQTGALKIVNPALISMPLLARFQSERQILARLSHPNIARLLDGGTTEDGLPWLVMEYVEGAPVDRWCRTHDLDIPARLRLFVKVCAAVEFAHRNLIVHRDIKPANILVDAHGEPRLLDFGVAKLIDPRAGADATRTELRVMTPRYASPEQICGRPITTATDIYSLGVVLYELLVGRFPFEAEAASTQSLQRAICESAPSRPSQAVRGPAAEGRGASAAMRRLSRDLAGDLDAVVLTALRKEPEGRYPSVAALIEDIENHLANRPVRARRAHWRYRVAKLAKRHRAAAAAITIGAVALIGMATLHAHRLTQERDRALHAEQLADREAQTARAVTNFLLETFGASDPLSRAPSPDLTARELLDRGVAALQAEQGSTEIPVRIALTMGRAYTGLRLPTSAGELAQQALRKIEARGSRESREHAEALEILGRVAALKDDWPQAREHARHALQIYERTAGPESFEAARVLLDLSDAHLMQDAGADALSTAERAVAILRKTRGPDALPTLDALLALANASMAAGRFGETLAHAQAAHAGFERLLGPRHVKVANALHILSLTCYRLGRYRQGLTFAERGLETMQAARGPRDQRLVALLRMVYLNANYLGDTRRAFQAIQSAIAINEASAEPNLENLYLAYGNLSKLLLDEGLLEASERHLNRSHQILTRIYGPDGSSAFSYNHMYYGIIARMRGDYDTARRQLDLAVAAQRKLFPEDHVETLKMRMHREYVEYYAGDLTRAAAGLGEVVETLHRSAGRDHPLSAQALGYLAAVSGALGKTELAERQFETSIERLQAKSGPASPIFLEVLELYAQLARGNRDAERARPILERLAQARAQRVPIRESDLRQ